MAGVPNNQVTIIETVGRYSYASILEEAKAELSAIRSASKSTSLDALNASAQRALAFLGKSRQVVSARLVAAESHADALDQALKELKELTAELGGMLDQAKAYTKAGDVEASEVVMAGARVLREKLRKASDAVETSRDLGKAERAKLAELHRLNRKIIDELKGVQRSREGLLDAARFDHINQKIEHEAQKNRELDDPLNKLLKAAEKGVKALIVVGIAFAAAKLLSTLSGKEGSS